MVSSESFSDHLIFPKIFLELSLNEGILYCKIFMIDRDSIRVN